MKIDSGAVGNAYTGGDRGWKGDVPVVRISADKIKEMGWRPKFNSQEALVKSIELMLNL
jgi:UDP-glucose 4-epimerase